MTNAVIEPATSAPSSNVQIKIRALQPGEDATAFRILNEEWITRYFALEPKDIEILNNPNATILSPGGRIFIAYADRHPVGCVALIPMPNGAYELSKMAVAPTMRRLGIGRRLLEHTIAYAREIGAKSLFLGSNSKLPSAVRLYESVGFRHVPSESLPLIPYSRADVFMDLVL